MKDVAHLRGTNVSQDTERMCVTHLRGEALCCPGEGARVAEQKAWPNSDSRSKSLAGKGLGGLEAQQGTGLPSDLCSLTLSYG